MAWRVRHMGAVPSLDHMEGRRSSNVLIGQELHMLTGWSLQALYRPLRHIGDSPSAPFPCPRASVLAPHSDPAGCLAVHTFP